MKSKKEAKKKTGLSQIVATMLNGAYMHGIYGFDDGDGGFDNENDENVTESFRD